MNAPPFSARLRAIVDCAVNTARGNLAEYGQLLPVCLLFNQDVRRMQVLGLPELGDKKSAALLAMRTMAGSFRATDAIIISEGWLLECTKPAAVAAPVDFADLQRRAKEFSAVPPSEHPDRIEAVLFNVQSREGRWSGFAKMQREAGAVSLGSVAWSPAQVGRFDNVLPPFRN